MPYIPPEEVGPYGTQNHWEPTEILYSGEPNGWSAAEGTFNGNPCLGLRWNGDETQHGYPTGYRGRPVWFIVPKELEEAVRVAVKVMVLWQGFREGG